MQELMINSGEQLQYWLFFSLLILFIALERWVPRRQPKSLQSKRRTTNAAMTVLVIVCLPILPLSLITAAYWSADNQLGLLNNLSIELPILMIIGFTLLLRGFISFFTHLLNHKFAFLWRFHRVHHMDTELDVSSTVRFHPLEMVFSLIVGLPLVVLFGLSPWVMIFYELLDISVVLFSHSNIRIPTRINNSLRLFIVTPELHRVHHSTVEVETNSNYSAVFPIWDIIFKTFRTTTKQPTNVMPLGLDEVDEIKAASFWWLLRSPFISLEKPITKLADVVTD